MTLNNLANLYSATQRMKEEEAAYQEAVRIESISEQFGLSFKNYLELEHFYLSVAHDAALEEWERDRLMYWFKEDFLGELGSPPSTARADLPHRRKRLRPAELKERPK